jgi:hypothetical protein
MIFLLKRIYLKLVQKANHFVPAKTLLNPRWLNKGQKILNYLFSTFLSFRKQPRNKYQTAFMVTRSVL